MKFAEICQKTLKQNSKYFSQQNVGNYFLNVFFFDKPNEEFWLSEP